MCLAQNKDYNIKQYNILQSKNNIAIVIKSNTVQEVKCSINMTDASNCEQ